MHILFFRKKGKNRQIDIESQRKKRSKKGGVGKVRQAHQHMSRGTIISRRTLVDGRGGETDKVFQYNEYIFKKCLNE